jgi:hypothetical protein
LAAHDGFEVAHAIETPNEDMLVERDILGVVARQHEHERRIGLGSFAGRDGGTDGLLDGWEKRRTRPR